MTKTTYAILFKHLLSIDNTLFASAPSGEYTSELFRQFLSTPWSPSGKSITKQQAGINPQEATFRLFAILRLIPEFNRYQICEGSINIDHDLRPLTHYSSLLETSVKDNGNKSDLTLWGEHDIIVTTSKDNDKTAQVGKYDIDAIENTFNKRHYKKERNLRLCIVVQDKASFWTAVKRAQKSSKDEIEVIQRESTLIFDWNDLCRWFHTFRQTYTAENLADLMNTPKVHLSARFHQDLTITYSKHLVEVLDQKIILWNHHQRSGKSYMSALLTDLLCRHKSTAAMLFISLRPDSLAQVIEIYRSASAFRDWTIIDLDRHNMEVTPTHPKMLVFSSKQFLQLKQDNQQHQRKIDWLANHSFDIRFIDECHEGGCTELAQQVFNTYGAKAPTVLVTATCSKPRIAYQVPDRCVIRWDMEDIKLAKCYDDSVKARWLQKFDPTILESVLTRYPAEIIRADYQSFPDLQLLYWKCKDSTKQMIFNEQQESEGGFSINALFMLERDHGKGYHFKHQEEVEFFIRSIFTVPTTKSVSIKQDNLLSRMESIAKYQNSRWFRTEDPSSMLFFLPCNLKGSKLKMIQKCFIDLLKKLKVTDEFDVMYLNSQTYDSKVVLKEVETQMSRTRQAKKKGLIILTGRQLSLAVSIPHCLAVFMLHNFDTLDLYSQMMTRPLTELPGKHIGFVVDLNLHRMVRATVEIAHRISPHASTRDGIRYLLDSNILNFDGQNLLHHMDVVQQDVDQITNAIQQVWNSTPSQTTQQLLDRLQVQIQLDKQDQSFLNKQFKSVQKTTSIVIDDLSHPDRDLPDGLTRQEIPTSSESENDTDNEEQPKVPTFDFVRDMIQPIIPISCLLTIYQSQLIQMEDMLNFINDQTHLKSVFEQQALLMWKCKGTLLTSGQLIGKADLASARGGAGIKTDLNILPFIIKMFNKYLKERKECADVVRRVKELFLAAHQGHNSNTLSQLVEEYLVPSDAEKKDNGEFTTPTELCNQMLDSLPAEFFTNPTHKVFEPCAGKGVFLLNIVERFMKGLQTAFPNEEERRRHIVENMLYWAEFNDLNVFICRLLLDPKKQYQLKYYQGDTLLLHPENIWNIPHFDAIIGNPPYQPKSDGKKGGKSLWPQFVRYALDHIRPDGYLTFVHPSLWRKPNNELHDTLFNKQFVYLSLHDSKDGIRTFKAGTRYDWYTLQNCTPYQPARVRFDDGSVEEMTINLDKLYIPNHGNDILEKVAAHATLPSEHCLNAHRSSEGHTQREYVQKEHSADYDYPLINSMSKGNGITLRWSSKALDHQDKPKVIFSNSATVMPFYDKGVFGTTEGGIYILVQNQTEGQRVCRFLKSKLVSYIVAATKWSNFETNKQVFWILPKPSISLHDQFTDADLYRLFKLTQSQIDRIESQFPQGLDQYKPLDPPSYQSLKAKPRAKSARVVKAKASKSE